MKYIVVDELYLRISSGETDFGFFNKMGQLFRYDRMADYANYSFRVSLFQKFQRIFHRIRHHIYGITSGFSSKIQEDFRCKNEISWFSCVEISRKLQRNFAENTQYSLVYFGSFVIIISNLDVRVVTILPFQYFPLFLGEPKFSNFFWTL